MPHVNHLTFGGNLTRDPEVREISSGAKVCVFSVANNIVWYDDSGMEHSEVCYLDVEAWGKVGETIAKHFEKGSPILVWGRLRFNTWEDKETGEKRSKHRLTITTPGGGFDFCGNKNALPQAMQPSSTNRKFDLDDGNPPACDLRNFDNDAIATPSYDDSPPPVAPPPLQNSRKKKALPPAWIDDLDSDVPF